VVIVSAPNGTYNRYGNLVVIKHDDASEAPYSLYAHLSERKVSKGRRVRAGQIIGKMGNLAATAAEPSKMVRTHLHFELLKHFPAPPDADRIDPTPYLVAEKSPFTYTSPALYSQTSPLLYENVSPLAGLGVISGAGSQFGGALVVGGIAFLIYKLTNQQRIA
jgi:murein DD-endopeptidase MepM/ murein hydrolase activator NlpD